MQEPGQQSLPQQRKAITRMPAIYLALLAPLALLLSIVAPACGPDDPENGPPDNGEPVDENTVTKTIGIEGGLVSAGGCWISIAAGAIEEPTEITVTQTELTPHEGFHAFSYICLFEPFDTELMESANVKLRFNGPGELASLFHAVEEEGRFRRIGGALDGSWIGAHISRLGLFFVGSGVDIVDPPDLDCVRARMIGGHPNAELSAVALHFAAEDCEGRPIATIDPASLVLRENSAQVPSSDIGGNVSDEAQQVLVTLLLDVSAPVQSEMASVVSATRALIDEFMGAGLPVRLSIELFAGGDEAVVWAPFRLLDSDVRASVGDIVFDLPEDRIDPNLHGAVVDSLGRLQEAREEVEAWNHGGTLTSGFMVLLSSQKDGAGVRTLEEAKAAVDAAGEKGVRVFGVGLHGGDFDPFSLEALAPDGMSTGRATDLEREMLYVSGEIIASLESQKFISYCSGQTQGQHSASVEIAGPASSEPALLEFDASGFDAECDGELLAAACEDLECGGLGCGTCDDRTSECDPESRTCVSFCERPTYCGGDTFTNPRGYEQTCPLDDTNTRCEGRERCVDITSSTDHCGDCWSPCNEGFICEDRECVCPEGLTDCAGVCLDTSSDTENCGDCGIMCAEGGTCEDGDCVCPGDDGVVCDDICRDVANDPLNCGDCGVVCAEENLVGCNHGECGGIMWSQTPMPNPAESGLPNAVTYETQTHTVTDNITGFVWQREAPHDDMTWSEAASYCRQLDLGDGSTWRLPSRIELVSLVDFTRASPAMDEGAFPGAPGGWFWTASPSAGAHNQAWAVDFSGGDSGTILTSVRAKARCIKN